MTQRSKLSIGAVAKNVRHLLPHPWIGLKLMALEGEKWLFNLLNPNAAAGKARSIRQVSIRITDVCNLRCHTCGHWSGRASHICTHSCFIRTSTARASFLAAGSNQYHLPCHCRFNRCKPS